MAGAPVECLDATHLDWRDPVASSSGGGQDDLRQEVEELKRQQAVQAATQAGAQATQAANQEGQMATTAATTAGLGAAVAAGGVGLVVGIFLVLAIARS